VNDPWDDGRARLLDEKQQAYLQGWVEESAPLLGLPGWRFVISPLRSDSDTRAESFIREAADESFITVSKEWLGQDPDEQRVSLTHEMLHAHFHPVTRMVEILMEAELGKRAEAIFERAVFEVEERCIDRLARGIADTLPMVRMPGARKARSRPRHGRKVHRR
jgi:hypothetical protein